MTGIKREGYYKSVVKEKKEKLSKIFLKNFIGGIGWIAGVTIGFTLLITIISFLLRILGGLPVIGKFFATIVVFTQKALENKNLIGK